MTPIERWGIPAEAGVNDACPKKRYWDIEIMEGYETVFRVRLPGRLSSEEITTILQRLAARSLSAGEVLAASIRKPSRTTLLEVRVDSPPNGKRMMVWVSALSDYIASYWGEEELTDRPEIVPVE